MVLYLSFHELFDIIIMSLILGFLFKDYFKPAVRKSYVDDPVAHYVRPRQNKLKDFWFATMIIAPSVILHELAHKFVAIGFGLQATFHAFYANSTTLMLGIFAIVAKISGMGLVFLVPGYVQIIGNAPPFEHAIIAFAGPLIHALFWLGALLYLKLAKKPSKRAVQFAHLLKYVNGFLFILNMLPIPGIDGFAVYTNLFKMI